MTHVTCRLTAKNRDQLRNPTLHNPVWATFTFYCFHRRLSVCLFAGVMSLRRRAQVNAPAESYWLRRVPRRRQAPRLDECVEKGVPGAEYAMYPCFVQGMSEF